MLTSLNILALYTLHLQHIHTTPLTLVTSPHLLIPLKYIRSPGKEATPKSTNLTIVFTSVCMNIEWRLGFWSDIVQSVMDGLCHVFYTACFMIYAAYLEIFFLSGYGTLHSLTVGSLADWDIWVYRTMNAMIDRLGPYSFSHRISKLSR